MDEHLVDDMDDMDDMDHGRHGQKPVSGTRYPATLNLLCPLTAWRRMCRMPPP